MKCKFIDKFNAMTLTSMVTSRTDPSSSVTRARAAFPVDCFFLGVCALASDSGAGAAVGDFASAGIFSNLFSGLSMCHVSMFR